MRKYSHISVQVPEPVLDLFLARVSELAAGSWQRDTSAEDSAGEIVQGMGVRYVYFTRVNDPRTEIVFLYEKEKLQLCNVFTKSDTLSHAQHAKITASLWNGGMSRAVTELKITGTYTPTRDVLPEQGLPLPVLEALNRFAIAANKSTGSGHPSDMEYWCIFLALSHATGAVMDEERLDAYLTSKKFPDSVVSSLLKEHELAMALLPLYDQILEARASVGASSVQ